ncbi:hypothetical protein FNV43_RR21533 [Rhamnella rubrinervis]|uniref:Neprosin PEP catalytic domain-containing protein n=1 Tax=Rhamnella rubrinervis TaxID=2594499 RepID=A0A8K0E3B1_9ROSA|nr:hypothetical protein FNV43_RR21533 [Rhamnella rubrinervis]
MTLTVSTYTSNQPLDILCSRITKSRFSKKQIKSIESSSVGSPLEINEQSKGCPSGRVPIQRSKSNHQFTQDFPGQHFATIDTTKSTTFHGAQVTIAINRPPVSSDQYSMAQVWVQSGPAAELNVIQAGWAADGFKSAGCYNVQCPGFVQVDPTYRPGESFQNISIPRGIQYLFDVLIIQELFNHLGDGAAVVRYGGTTSAATDTGLSPQMGTGSLPNRDYTTGVGFFIRNKIMGSDFVMNDILLKEMAKNVDSPAACYDLGYYGFVSTDVRETFSYGGPGGASCGT